MYIQNVIQNLNLASSFCYKSPFIKNTWGWYCITYYYFMHYLCVEKIVLMANMLHVWNNHGYSVTFYFWRHAQQLCSFCTGVVGGRQKGFPCNRHPSWCWWHWRRVSACGHRQGGTVSKAPRITNVNLNLNWSNY